MSACATGATQWPSWCDDPDQVAEILPQSEEWRDIVPIPQNEAENAIVPIDYSETCKPHDKLSRLVIIEGHYGVCGV